MVMEKVKVAPMYMPSLGVMYRWKFMMSLGSLNSTLHPVGGDISAISTIDSKLNYPK